MSRGMALSVCVRCFLTRLHCLRDRMLPFGLAYGHPPHLASRCVTKLHLEGTGYFAIHRCGYGTLLITSVTIITNVTTSTTTAGITEAIMTPKITQWSDFAHISDEVDPETGEFGYTMLVAVDADDGIHYADLPIPKSKASPQQAADALQPVPDCHIFPKWPSSPGKSNMCLTKASQLLQANGSRFFVKRPNLSQYDILKRHNAVHILAQALLEEAYAMEFLCQHPHPNIVRYHGCCSRGDYLTGIVLDRYPRTLADLVENGTTPGVSFDKAKFMGALQSAICHLHSLGWAHNDLNPTNILVNEVKGADVVPILIDFGSARKVSAPLGMSRGTSGWIEGPIEGYVTSRREHDLFALNKIKGWLGEDGF